ncbi:FAD/NAD(P)-binding domain-containing protein [Piedraia hortae CBS 480.64]|uniref:FAD/NAD(P)-binding domain-containing protein n=1 Tax=Piedraia hortae CBS 480.64 TaxID=1314780 RepID=A0A6A7C1T2_9PEZI|nr:FAD/NAD(P)-binding domain-containing protein [Piedraia hortae CBS 480.64]
MDTAINDFVVAIVGGGLCGLSLATALKKRSIPFTIYEARSSFVELGAGINIGPNALEAFRLIDNSLGEAIAKLCTRNEQGKENVWFQVRLGAPSGEYEDARLITEVQSPPTGSMTVIRNELLQTLARTAGLGNARFNKKLVSLSQDFSSVQLKFADGTDARANVVIACDGIHSATRQAMLGPNHPATNPQYSDMGAFRAVVSVDKLAAAIGWEQARNSQMYLGPDAYVVMYPIERAQKVNVGLWPWHRVPWSSKEWVVPNQREKMKSIFESWGETVHRIMDVMGDPPFYATHHVPHLKDIHQGQVLLIGDAAHAMTPHQGAGAGQGMEDVYVIAELLTHIDKTQPLQAQIDAAFFAYEAVRFKRADQVAQTSMQAMEWLADFYTKNITLAKLEEFATQADKRLRWIWEDDIAGQATTAVELMKSRM